MNNSQIHLKLIIIQGKLERILDSGTDLSTSCKIVELLQYINDCYKEISMEEK